MKNANQPLDNALSVANVALGYGQGGHFTPVLQDVNFSVPSGSLTCLLGASGVGKSSLLQLLAGLEQPQQGQIRLFGEPIVAPHRHIAMVFQTPTLLPWLTVAENIAFGLKLACRSPLSKTDIAVRVAKAIEEVGLTGYADRLPSTLSGGMAQRVNLARAMVQQPKLLLLDEPFSALDPVSREQMQQLLQQLVQQHQTTAVMITHDIDEALAVSDQLLLLGKKESETAHIVGHWQLVSPRPRTDLLALNAIRVNILQHLQAHRPLVPPSLDYMI